MLKYPEVYTNLDFVSIPNMPLQIHVGVAIDTQNKKEAEDGAYEGSAIDSVYCENNLPQWR